MYGGKRKPKPKPKPKWAPKTQAELDALRAQVAEVSEQSNMAYLLGLQRGRNEAGRAVADVIGAARQLAVALGLRGSLLGHDDIRQQRKEVTDE